MFKNLLTITLRSFLRQNIFSIINILGLSIGLAVVLLISLLSFYELSFDRGFKESKNIYRINAVTDDETFIATANAIGPAIQEIPEVITTVRLIKRRIDFIHNENALKIDIKWADEDFFRLFDTPFILGRPEDVMSRPNVIALSDREAKRLFGNDDPLGQMLYITWNRGGTPIEVVAVFKSYPENSSLSDFAAIAPFMHNWEAATHKQISWMRSEFETFCLLDKNADVASVNTKIQKIVSEAIANLKGIEWRPQLQRFTDVHLHSKKYAGESSFKLTIGDIGKVRIMSLLSVIILLVACVNYMNLSTARAQKRSKEIGISKTAGAQRSELILRLTLETAIFTFVSFIIAFMLARVLLPVFNNLAGAQLSLGLALQPMFLCVVLLIWIVTTFLAAAYPALYLSGFPPLTAIQSKFIPNSSHAVVRKMLTVGQFTVAIVLISWVLMIQLQIKFVNNKDLGYNPHNLIGFWIHDGNPVALLNELRAHSSVEMVTRENQSIVYGASENILFRDPDDQTGFNLKVIAADNEFIDVMQMKLIAGSRYPVPQLRDTIVSMPTGESRTVRMPQDNFTNILLNRAAVDYLGMTPEEAIGKRVMVKFYGLLGYPVVCGVIENYHFESLHRPVGGVCIHYGLANPKYYLVLRVIEGNLSEQIKIFEGIFKKYFPNNLFERYFIEEDVAKLYDGERRTVRIAVVFSILAILVACMGVFGLTAFMAEQRRREIGIRKVMGASVWDIVKLFTSDYVKLLGISLVIAIPLAWWVCERYLQNFAYRISLSWWIFAVASLITALLTLLTVGVLAMKAAMNNPVESLK